MRKRKFNRELARAAGMSLPALMKQAARNKRLLKNALNCQFRRAYAARKALCKALGRAIARKMRQA